MRSFITYFSPNIIRMFKSKSIQWAGNIARIGQKMHTYRVLLGKAEGKIPLGKQRRRWEDNIKMDVGEVGWGCGLNSSGSRQGLVASSCEHGNEQ
jgi:hypothetical protein